MNPLDFLRAILPADGYYAWVRIKNKKPRQVLTDSIEALKPIARNAVEHGADLYFGCAAYSTDQNRTKTNVKSVKSFWLDLDCGDDAPYATKQEGHDALRAFCKRTGMPKPFVVDSGRGLHVYWPLEQSILAAIWQVYANSLVKLCAARGLDIKDPGCSTDVARILRVPGTLNYKNPDAPLQVRLLHTGAITPWDTFQKTLQSACGEADINGFHEPTTGIVPYAKLDATTRATMGLSSQIASFKKILHLSAAGKGCEQIIYAYENQADIREPFWRAVLSVAHVCDDRDKAIHIVSRKHPKYDAAETEEKAARTVGPLSCAEFCKEGIKGLCETCTYHNKLKSPISIGHQIAESTNPIVVESIAAIVGVTEESLIPELPFPYFRGVKGGIFRKTPLGPEGEPGEDEVIYEYNLDVIRRVIDPEKGATLIIHHALPMDGIKEFTISLSDAQSTERMKDVLSFNEVVAHKPQMNKIGTYMVEAVRQMQKNTAADMACTQMGWTEDMKGIVWGRRLFTADGPRYSPPASKAVSVANMMKQVGTFESWEEVAGQYGKPGFELHACCMLLALGSLLNPFTHEDPVWIHLFSSDSGTGKTTLLRVINSMWGDPQAMLLTVVDTWNSVEKRRVVFNNIALCQDEITNIPVEQLSEIAYSQSQGREKNRLSNASTEMVNNDRRCNNFFTNGNRSMMDALSSVKTNAAGEFARMIEVPLAALPEKVAGEDNFSAIYHNYGHVGPLFAMWLLTHKDEIQGRVDAAKMRFEIEFKGLSSERNWVATTAILLTMFDIVREMGILKSYDLDRLYASWTRHMHLIRNTTSKQIVSHKSVLADFINENHANIVIPDSHVATVIAANPTTASLYGKKTERDARNKLVVRWESTTRTLFISQSEFRIYCNRRSHSYIDFLAYYTKQKSFLGVIDKALGEGTGVVSIVAKVLAFEITPGSELDSAIGRIV